MENIVKGLVELAKGLGQDMVNVEGIDYHVLTQCEIDERFEDLQRELFDDLRFDAYSEDAKDYIIDNFVDEDWFTDLEYEVRMEQLEYMDKDEIDEILEQYGADSFDEICEEYVQDNMSGDSIQWYINEFSDQDTFEELVIENDLLDLEGVCDYIKECDGYTILASYDGWVEEYYDAEEYETYYIYRD